MNENIVIDLLKGITSKKELNELVRYIQAPIINKTEDVNRLIKYYVRFYPSFEDTDKLTPAFVSNKLFRLKDNPEQRLQRILKQTSPLIKSFLVLKQLKREPFIEDLLLLKSYNHYKRFNQYEKEYKKIDKKIKNAPAGEDNSLSLYHVYSDFYRHAFIPKTTEKSLKVFEDRMRQMDYFYYISKLKSEIDAVFLTFLTKKFKRSNFKTQVEQNIKELLKEEDNDDNSLIIIKIYYNVLTLLQQLNSKDIDHIHDLYLQTRELAERNRDRVQFKEQQSIFLMLMNIATIFVNNGKTRFNTQLYLLYRFGLEHNLIIVDGQMNDMHFLNIINIAVTIGKLNWLEQEFKDKYLLLLNKNIQEQARVLTENYISFERKLFLKTYNSLNETNFTSKFHGISARVLKLKAAYMLPENIDLFENAYQSFRIFLTRNNKKFGSQVLIGNENFNKFTNRLDKERTNIRLYKAQRKEIKEMLLQSLEAETQIISKKWLRQEIEKL